MNDPLKIRTESDYDGYFTAWVRSWMEKKKAAGKPFKHKVLVVSAGPYRMYACNITERGDTLEIDFYSPLRNGFGGLSQDAIDAIVEKL